MSASRLAEIRCDREIPLGWAGSTTAMNYLNFGDALSPVMVALVSGKPVRRVPFNSLGPRLAAVGSIGHGFRNGEVHVWGTGCSNWANPSAPGDQRVRYIPPDNTSIFIHATRGPVSQDLLSGGEGGPDVFGDPVWLLPRFYRPTVEKRWPLGVVLHLSDLADRGFAARAAARLARYVVPPEFADTVHLITTVTPIGVDPLKDKIDEILSCERIVSASLHGVVIAEAYGIPCLHFASTSVQRGLGEIELDPAGPLDLRVVDLYRGLGRSRLACYFQPRLEPTDWAAVIKAVDAAWTPAAFEGDRLIDAFPLEPNPIAAAPGETIWQHPLIRGLTLQHDVGQVHKADHEVHGRPAATPAPAEPAKPDPVRHAFEGSEESRRLLLRMNEERLRVPLSWVASTAQHPHANLGDALSAVIVGAMTGLPVTRAAFDQAIERVVAVGTIGQNQRNGRVHFWGTGVDASRNPVDPLILGYVRPPDTDFVVHAMRGPHSARTFRSVGIEVPEVYGDPVYLLPRFWPMTEVEKTHDLGVIVHISELTEATATSGARKNLKRYLIPKGFEERVRIINTYCEPTLEAMRAKVAEIVSCRAIVSTSLHGLVIAETYGIPCAWFATFGRGEGRMLELENPNDRVDHRMIDFYTGVGRSTLSAYCTDRSRETNWEAVIDWVRSRWAQVVYDPRALIEAFPLPRAVLPQDAVWTIPEHVMAKIHF